MQIRKFFHSCLRPISTRRELFVLFNCLFFGCVFVAALFAQFVFSPSLFLGWSPRVPEVFVWSGTFLFFGIFLFNLVVAAFVFVTLPGFVFFPLSVVALLFRAVLWGLLVYDAPSWVFLAALPVIIFEGEAYVVAALAGTVVGVSWFKLKWVCADEELSRVEAFKKGFAKCLRLYVVVGLLLFVAAIVETVMLLNV
ncbi:MAG: stage II sporulation protein M [Candidatus Bathyarchaeia archaeon]